MDSRNEVVDLREIGAALRRGMPWIAGGALLGVLAGAATLIVLDREYEASATVLLRSQVGGNTSALALSRISGMLGGLPGGVGESAVETEQKLLTSRAVIGEVVDSLGLQARVTGPAGVRVADLLAEVRLAPDAAGGTFRFERRGDRFAVEGPGASGFATPGAPFRVPGGTLVLRRAGLPERFELQLSDRAGAVAWVENELVADVAGGEVVELTFRAGEPGLAAAVPNAMIAKYLQRRKTTDRGVNQHRYEFLTAHADSLAAQLAVAERALRRHQETSGVLDPELMGQTGLERAMTIQGELETAEVEARALRGIIDKGSTGRLSPRELAAFPTLFRNPAINSVLAKIMELETERVTLLEKRTERDPEVIALTDGIENLEGQLVSLSRDYLGGLTRQGEELRRELGGYRAQLGALPAQAEESLRREREVKRLSETLVALQTQLVEARLGAITEGGEVRQIDVAVPPRKPAFPNKVFSLLGGLLGGLFFGAIGAVVAGRLRREVREPWEAELATGVPAVAFDARLPLWLAGLGSARAAVVVPAGRAAEAQAVAEQLVATAALRGRDAMTADLTQPVAVAPPSRLALAAAPARVALPAGEAQDAAADATHPLPAPNSNGAGAAGPRAVLGELEARHDFVAAVLPGFDSPQTVSVLAPERPVVVVGRAGRVDQGALRDAVEVCERLGVPVAGIVLQPAGRGRGV